MYVYTMIQRSWFLRCRARTREILHTRATSESLSYLERSLLLFALGLRDAHVAHALLLRGARPDGQARARARVTRQKPAAATVMAPA